jgi:NAD(P)-dependent dehydrogenase (short-subunit alcohol dehydrogenase family)
MQSGWKHIGKLTGRVAVETGVGRHGGLGEAIALRLADEGADVAAVDLCRERPGLPREQFGQWDELQAVTARIAQTGRRTLAFKADVTSESMSNG